ncbi:MAG: DUF2079 domain-containing protein [Chloroflexota bacterium]|nr:DUF2079 domain-containing protein [Chloroflexota bacterium]
MFSPRRHLSSFVPLLLLPLVALRYAWHPFGITYGSSIWTYLLIPPLAITLSSTLAPLIRDVGRSHNPPSSKSRSGYVVWLLIGLYSLVFGVLAVERHTSFQSHALDVGTMSQAAWNTAEGRPFAYTQQIEGDAVDGVVTSNRLTSGKLELIFLALAPFYRLWPDPILLLLVQTLALALSAWPLYLALAALGDAELSRRSPLISPLASSRLPAALLTIAYLAYLPLHYVNMADFHPSALMPFFLAWAAYAIVKQRWRLYLIALLGALLCRADAAFVACGLGLFLLMSGKRGPGFLSLALGSAWFATDFLVIVPWAEMRFGPDPAQDLLQRFGEYGSSPLGMVWAAASDPQSLLSSLLSREKLQTAFDLLLPLGGISLAAPSWLIPALPVVLVNLLANSEWQGTIKAHYFAPVLPFMFLAAGYAVSRLAATRDGARPEGLALYVLSGTVLTAILLSPFPPGYSFQWDSVWSQSDHQRSIEEVLAQVSVDSVLSAQSNLVPHVANRANLFIYPNGISVSDEVLLDLDNAAERAPLDYFAYSERVQQLLNDPDFGLVAWNDGVLLLRRGAPTDSVRLAALRQAYDSGFYRVIWRDSAVPARMAPRQLYPVQVCFENSGSQAWTANNWFPVFVAYHWVSETGNVVLWDSERTRLPSDLYPGQQMCATVEVVSPDIPGVYTLQIDLVREEIAWFSTQGSPPLSIAVVVSEQPSCPEPFCTEDEGDG